MKREKNTSSVTVKSRKSSTSSMSSTSEELNESKSNVNTVQREETAASQGSGSKSNNLTVRFQNADMLTKYRNKNSHLKIENLRTTSNCLADEISDDDEIWVCEVPNAIDVNELVGKSIKLGSKKSLIKAENGQIECASAKFDSSNEVYQNTLSVVFQNNDSQLAVKNIKPVGRLTFYKKIDDTEDVFDLTPSGRHPCTIFPDNLAVRHPLLGRHFDEHIDVSEAIKKKLAEAKSASEQNHRTMRIKKERLQSENNVQESPRKSKKRQASETTEHSPKKVKKEVKIENGHDDDLVRLKELFGKSS